MLPKDKCELTGVNSSEVQPRRHVQAVIMGGAKVGKTAIVSQFLYDQGVHSYKPTVEELHRGEYEIEGESLVLDLLDTSGAHQFPAMRELNIKQSDAFILVYSITDSASWETVRHLRQEIINLRGEKVPIVIAGNKIDLEEDRSVDRVLSETTVCLDWSNAWIEISAFNPSDVLDLFKTVLSQGKIQYNLSPAVERRRKSLPANTRKRRHDKYFMKRHSCNVS